MGGLTDSPLDTKRQRRAKEPTVPCLVQVKLSLLLSDKEAGAVSKRGDFSLRKGGDKKGEKMAKGFFFLEGTKQRGGEQSLRFCFMRPYERKEEVCLEDFGWLFGR